MRIGISFDSNLQLFSLEKYVARDIENLLWDVGIVCKLKER